MINLILNTIILYFKKSDYILLYDRKNGQQILDIYHSSKSFSPKNKKQVRV